MQVKFKRLKPEAFLPIRATEHSAGYDLCIPDMVHIPAGQTCLIPLNFAIELPFGYEAQIRSRSGLALKHNIFVLNAPGTLDSDYRGNVGVILANMGATAHTFIRGERIAQMVIAKYESPDFLEVDELSETARAEGGFGSTGR